MTHGVYSCAYHNYNRILRKTSIKGVNFGNIDKSYFNHDVLHSREY